MIIKYIADFNIHDTKIISHFELHGSFIEQFCGIDDV